MAGENAGRRGRTWRRLVAAQRAKHLPCWLCGQPIDYTLVFDRDHPDPGCFSVDHAKPLSTHPHLAEDPANLRSSHLGCNTTRGQRAPAPGLGQTSQDW